MGIFTRSVRKAVLGMGGQASIIVAARRLVAMAPGGLAFFLCTEEEG